MVPFSKLLPVSAVIAGVLAVSTAFGQTVGTTGVRNFDPQLAPPTLTDSGSQYRVAPYPPIRPPFMNQSVLPQDLQSGPGQVAPSDLAAPPVQICPSGTVTANGLC